MSMLQQGAEMNGIETVTALRSAFDALSGVATPDQVAPVLRQALLTLLTAQEPASGQKSATLKPSKKNRSRWTGDLETWAPVRDKIRAVLNTRGISRRELATKLEISHATLRPSLLPQGRAPSRANIARLQRWLTAMEVRIVTERRPAEKGHAPPPPPAYRLTTAQREQLAGYRQLDEQTVRHQAGVTLEVIDAAVAGHSLAPEIVDRLVNFLAQAGL
jgi:hypothetical protein